MAKMGMTPTELPRRDRRAFARHAVPALLLAGLWAAGDAVRHGTTSVEGLLLSLAAAYVLTAVCGDLIARLPWPTHQRAGALFVLCYAVMAVNVALELRFFSTTSMEEILSIVLTNIIFLGPWALLLARSTPSVLPTVSWTDSVRYLVGLRSPIGWALRIVLACVAYVAVYFVVGAVAYNFTQPFYNDPALGMNLLVPPLSVILPLQGVRGLIYLAAFAPIIAGVDARRRVVGTLMGAVLFVAGALAPLVANTAWPIELRFYHSVEGLFLGFLTGWVMAWVLLPRRRPG